MKFNDYIDLVKPCPYCFKSPSLKREITGFVWISCFNNKCPVKPSVVVSRMHKAVEIWNRPYDKQAS